MVTETTSAADQITPEEIEAAKAAMQSDPNFNQDELMRKNSAVLTVMMPLPLRVLIDQAAVNPDGTEGSAADWVRQLLAERLNYTLPTKGTGRAKKDKRSIEIQQRAQRSMVAELIEKARKGEISL